VDVNGNILMKNAQYAYCLLDVELWTGNTALIEWSLTASRLKGYVGYGITVFPFSIDVEHYERFSSDTMMIQSWNGVLYGGKMGISPKKLKWLEKDKIKFIFNPKLRSLSIQKVSNNLPFSFNSILLRIMKI